MMIQWWVGGNEKGECYYEHIQSEIKLTGLKLILDSIFFVNLDFTWKM